MSLSSIQLLQVILCGCFNFRNCCILFFIGKKFNAFRSTLENTLGKLLSMSSSFMPMIKQMGALMGINANIEETTAKLHETLESVREINKQFKDPEITTFVCVCIAEFLSMYETERLIQALLKQVTKFSLIFFTRNIIFRISILETLLLINFFIQIERVRMVKLSVRNVMLDTR